MGLVAFVRLQVAKLPLVHVVRYGMCGWTPPPPLRPQRSIIQNVHWVREKGEHNLSTSHAIVVVRKGV
jgi:hypothetical protein